MSSWTKAWIAWTAAAGVSFGVLENRALKVPGASLSEHTRTVFGFDNHGPLRTVRRAVFVGTWTWFGIHILSKTSGCVFPDRPPTPSA